MRRVAMEDRARDNEQWERMIESTLRKVERALRRLRFGRVTVTIRDGQPKVIETEMELVEDE